MAYQRMPADITLLYATFWLKLALYLVTVVAAA